MTEQIDVGVIYRSATARPLDKNNIQQLAQSIKEVGLINPISVRRAVHHRGGQPIEAFDIIAGGHRYEAVCSLGWTTIECKVVDLGDLQSELAEIDENIIRADLSAAQQAKALARRKEIYLILHPETAQYVAGAHAANKVLGRDASANVSFASATADAVGKSKRTIEKSVEWGTKLADHIDDIQGTSLDSVRELDALVKLPKDKRAELVRRAKQNEQVSAKPVKIADAPLNDFETKEKWIASIMAIWNRGSAEWREEFLARVDQPVMDRRFA